MKKRVNELAKELHKLLPDDLSNVAIMCIGTDRSTGDSLGPFVGRYLKRRGIPNVYGDLKNPVHAMNLEEYVELTKDKFVLAVDASLGATSRVGSVRCESGPLRPGSGVGKELQEVGDAHVVGIVNVGGFMEYFVLQNTRLALIDELSTIIGRAIYKVYKERRQYETVSELVAVCK